jgi:hypothetical protein
MPAAALIVGQAILPAAAFQAAFRGQIHEGGRANRNPEAVRTEFGNRLFAIAARDPVKIWVVSF